MKDHEETKAVSLEDFSNKSFECLFNQNVHLHCTLAQVLQDEFKKQEKRKAESVEKIELLGKILVGTLASGNVSIPVKKGFIFWLHTQMQHSMFLNHL